MCCVTEDIFTEEIANEGTNSSEFLNRLKLNHKKLCGHKNTTVVVINDYSVFEVDQLLQTVLGLEVCPPNVAEMVHKLSGGNPFWCNEMALFIFKTGAGSAFIVIDIIIINVFVFVIIILLLYYCFLMIHLYRMSYLILM